MTKKNWHVVLVTPQMVYITPRMKELAGILVA